MQLHATLLRTTTMEEKTNSPIELSCHDVMMHTCNILYACIYSFIYSFSCAFSLFSLLNDSFIANQFVWKFAILSFVRVWTYVDWLLFHWNTKKTNQERKSKPTWGREREGENEQLNGTSKKTHIIIHSTCLHGYIWTLLYCVQRTLIHSTEMKKVNGPDIFAHHYT